MSRGKEQQLAYVRWLRRYDWLWFCTLTFRPGIRRFRSIADLFEEWINAIEQIERHKISWARTVERGGQLGRLHVHAVIAGAMRVSAQSLRFIWNDIAGHAEIGLFDDGSDCLKYLLKSIEEGPDYDFDAAPLKEHLLPPSQLRSIDQADPEFDPRLLP